MARPKILDQIENYTAPSEAEIRGLSPADAEEKAEGVLKLVKGFFDAQDDNDEVEASSEWREHIKTLNQSAEELFYHAREGREMEQIKTSANSRLAGVRTPSNGLGLGSGHGAEQLKSAGEQFVESDAYLNLIQHGKTVGSGEAGKFGQVGIEIKTLVTGSSATSAGAFSTPERQPNVDLIRRELTVLDLVTRGTTSSEVLEYIIEGAGTNNAAIVAEASASTGSTGSSPESALAFSKATAAIKEISHYIPITRRALADVGQMRTYIDSTLRYGVDEALEAQVLNGDGLGENFAGITNVAGTTAQAFATDILTTTRKARTKAKTTGRVRPTGILMTPDNWEEIDLLKDGNGRYYYGGPSNLGNARLWGLPVVESEILAANTAIIADFRHAYLLDREQTQILASDSNSDWFLRKIIALLAIGRFGFYVQRPAAFVEAALAA